MTHGEKMAAYGKILALQETMLHIQKEIGKLKKQLEEAEEKIWEQ